MSRRGENIYKRKDGRWEGRYKKGRKLDGTILYGYVYGKSYSEIKKNLIAHKAQYLELVTDNGELAMTFEDWALTWLQEMKKKVKVSTFSHYEYKVHHYLLPYLGKYPVNQITSEVLQVFLKHLEQKSLGASTIRLLFQLLKQCLNGTPTMPQLLKNPCDQVQLPRVQKRNICALTRTEQNNIEKAALKIDFTKGFPVLLALQAGMRIGEIAALKWEDLDFDQKVIHVRQTYQRISRYAFRQSATELHLSSAKSQSAIRVIPMTGQICQILKEQKSHQESEFVFSVNDRPCEPRLITYHFHRIREEIGLQEIHFHQLRHTFATRCIEAKADIASVSALMGHRSTQMTLDIYTDALLDQRIQTIKSMETQLKD